MDQPRDAEYAELLAAVERVRGLAETIAVGPAANRKLQKAAEILRELQGDVIRRLESIESASHRN